MTMIDRYTIERELGAEQVTDVQLQLHLNIFDQIERRFAAEGGL